VRDRSRSCEKILTSTRRSETPIRKYDLVCLTNKIITYKRVDTTAISVTSLSVIFCNAYNPAVNDCGMEPKREVVEIVESSSNIILVTSYI
jgi:hypothetical protein